MAEIAVLGRGYLKKMLHEGYLPSQRFIHINYARHQVRESIIRFSLKGTQGLVRGMYQWVYTALEIRLAERDKKEHGDYVSE